MGTFGSRGRLRAGVTFDIPGVGYKNPRTGEIEGFEADIARAIAEKLAGSREAIEFIQVLDEQRIPALQHDRVDMIVSQLTITADRAEQVDFSIPYYVTREAILVAKGSSIRTFEDLRTRRIAVAAGSVSSRRMHAAFPEATLVVTPLSAGCLEAVARNEADAASNDMINLLMLRKFSDRPAAYEIIDIGDHFDPKPFGVAVKKGHKDLVERISGAIQQLIASGDIDRLLDARLAGAGI